MFFDKNAEKLKEKEQELLSIRKELEETTGYLRKCQAKNIEFKNKYSGLINADKYLQERQQETDNTQQLLKELNKKYTQAKAIYDDLNQQILIYRDTLEVGGFGLYQRQFNFETSEHFKNKIEVNFQRQKSLIKEDKAAICSSNWTVDGSQTKGKAMTNQYKKLMLLAFNGECDSIIAKVKWNNAAKSRERIVKAFENINKLGLTHNTSISTMYLDLKLEEFTLTYEYEEKKYEEREEQRRIREQMREEERAQKEFERAQKEASDEEKRFEVALEKARLELKTSSIQNLDILNEKVKLLEQKLNEAHERKERAIALAQLTKVGHIYVISNIGSFGENVYKIGMTRRLDPLDRVRELGDASVPFQFDVHAIIYSENAPQLEYELHQKFGDRRLNRINNRKEFFRVSLEDIERFVLQHSNAEIEFTKLAEAREYRETLTMLEQLNNISRTEESQNTQFPSNII